MGQAFRGIPRNLAPSGCQPAGAAKPCDFSRLNRAGLVAPDCIRATAVRLARLAIRDAVNRQRDRVHLFDLQMTCPFAGPQPKVVCR
jgi:hypothetical protein